MKKPILSLISLTLSLLMLASIVVALPLFSASAEVAVQGDATRLSVNKTVFDVNEPIMVTAKGSGKDWVGIYTLDGNASIRWNYVEYLGGKPADAREFNYTNNSSSPLNSIPEGEYIIRLMPNDQTDHSLAVAQVKIRVVKGGAQENDYTEGKVMGDTTRLSLEKFEFVVGEPILFSAVGEGKDWVGIYTLTSEASIRWSYVTTIGSGKQTNARLMPFNFEGSAYNSIPAGKYIIRLMPNDQTDHSLAVAWAVINVVEGKVDAVAPLSATYTLDNDTDGFAAGTLSVKMPADSFSGHGLLMYWGDENGRLEGYGALSKVKVTGETTTFSFAKNMIIPTGATKLMIYTAHDSGDVSDTCVTVDLPEGAAHKDPGAGKADLFVMSDIHIKTDTNHVHNKNFARMLADVTALNSDALGIFVVGDIADTANEQEYQNMLALYNAQKDAPPIYLAVGNHDMGGDFEAACNTFLKYATLPDGTHPTDTSYDFWFDGYHFIFLGTDKASGLYADLSDETHEWLYEKLSENRDPERPCFVFLHQSLSGTVSGSLPGEGWSGVKNEEALRAVLSEFPEAIMFNGHSHWTMDSVGNMFEGDTTLPCRIFNCASVAYLWSGYNSVGGEHLDGSQGYMVRLYDGKLYVLGRDFARGEWIPSAQYCIVLAQKEDGGEQTPPAQTPTEAPQTPTNTPTSTPTEATKQTEKKKGCGGSISALSLVLGTLLLTGMGVTFGKKTQK